MRVRLALLALVAVLAGCGGDREEEEAATTATTPAATATPIAPQAPSSTGTVEIEQVNIPAPDGKVFIEGSRQFYVLRDRATDSVAAEGMTAEMRRRELPPGEYRLESYTRSCSATCQNLDPPTGECSADFDLKAGQRRAFEVGVTVGEDCTITRS